MLRGWGSLTARSVSAFNECNQKEFLQNQAHLSFAINFVYLVESGRGEMQSKRVADELANI